MSTGDAATPSEGKSCRTMIDVRSEIDYNAENAGCTFNIPRSELQAGQPGLSKVLALVGGDTSAAIGVHCYSGNKAGQVKSYLESEGFTNVENDRGWLSGDKDSIIAKCVAVDECNSDANDAAATTDHELVLTTKEDIGYLPDSNMSCDCSFSDISTPLAVSSTALTFGFYEIRAKMADASLRSSFWLQGDSGEINILDTVPASINNGLRVNNNYHCFDQVNDGIFGSSTESNETAIANLDPSDGYHTYGVDRTTNGAVKFYVDGMLIRTLTPNDASCLEQPMYVIFSMETITEEGIPSPFTTYTSHIKYFRFWTPTVTL